MKCASNIYFISRGTQEKNSKILIEKFSLNLAGEAYITKFLFYQSVFSICQKGEKATLIRLCRLWERPRQPTPVRLKATLRPQA